MTTRNLDALFRPKNVVLVGASHEPGTVGYVAARNLAAAGFSGDVWMVNPHAAEIMGRPCVASVAELPGIPDLAIVATPARTVPGLIAELGQRGCRAAIVISAGFDAGLRQEMLEAAKPHLMRIVGPNCLGFLSTPIGLNASFAHMPAPPGDLAFVTQSGAVATSILDWAAGHGVGFSHMVSLGDMADVDFGDLLDYLALDSATRAILLYAEGITQARKFMSAGRIAARTKPVIVVKGGRSASGAKAATSHTGALAGADAVYDAAFRRAGMLRVDTLRELFDAAETLAAGLHIAGDRLAIVTNGGGLGVLAADALERSGGSLASLSDAARQSLNKVLPSAWSHGDPVDIMGDAHADRYEATLDILAPEPDSDAILVMNCPTGVSDSLGAAQALVQARQRHNQKPMIACWTGEASAAEPRRVLTAAGLASYETPDDAVAAFMHLAEYGRNQRALFETPQSPQVRAEPKRAAARAVIERVQAQGRATLTEPEAKEVLAAYGIPVVETRIVQTPSQAGAAADAIGGPVVLKILSRQITHKTDVYGVRLDLCGDAEVEQAAEIMQSVVMKKRPDARIDGFTVQPMVKRPLAQELLLGAVTDATFGPCLMFGQGGVAAEVVADRCIGLPPLTANLALDMIDRTRVARLLAGYRDRPPAQRAAIAGALTALSDIVVDLPEIAELDINPLLADGTGVLALDARIILRPTGQRGAGLAIQPYPPGLARDIVCNGLALHLRPIRPEDADALVAMAKLTSAEDIRMRFHGAIHALTGATAARLSQIDYDREMVLVAESGQAIVGVVRLVFDPDIQSAECAIIVRTDHQRRGVGRLLLDSAMTYARSRGAARVHGAVMTSNHQMLTLVRQLGAEIASEPSDARLTRVTFQLAQPATDRAPDLTERKAATLSVV